MCPQPLSFYGGTRAWHDVHACDALVTSRPEIATAIARLLLVYSHIERERILLITSLMKSEFRAVMSMVQAVESEKQITAMLDELVRQRVDSKDMGLWKRLNGVLKAARSARNTYAHGIVVDVLQTGAGRPPLPEVFIPLIEQSHLNSVDTEAEEVSHEVVMLYDQLNKADATSRPAVEARIQQIREKYLRPNRVVEAMLERAGKKMDLEPQVAVDVNPDLVTVFSLADVQGSTNQARAARHYLEMFAWLVSWRLRHGGDASDDLREKLFRGLPALPAPPRSPPPSVT